MKDEGSLAWEKLSSFSSQLSAVSFQLKNKTLTTRPASGGKDMAHGLHPRFAGTGG